MMKYVSPLVLGAFAVISFCGHAKAASETFNLTSAPITSLNGSFSFTGFDPSLGTLSSITLDLTSAASVNVSIINSASTAGSFTNAFANFQYSLTAPDSMPLFTNAMVSSTVASGTANAGPFVVTNYPATTTNTTVNTAINSGFSFYETANPDFSYSSGTGTYGGSTADSLLFSGDASVTPSGTITYNYVAAAPEPAAWAMGAICMSLFALLRFTTGRKTEIV